MASNSDPSWYHGDSRVTALSKDKQAHHVRSMETRDEYDIPRRMKLDKPTVDKLPLLIVNQYGRRGEPQHREDVVDGIPDPQGLPEMIIRDSSRPGFGVIVYETKKTFIAERERRVKVGTVGVETITEAWTEAQEKLRDMRKGKNPNEEKRKEKEAEADRRGLKLKQVLDDALESKDLSPPVEKEYRQMLSRFFADWMNKPVSEITGPKVLQRLKELRQQAKRKGNKGHGVDYGFKALSSVINFAQIKYPDIVKVNPVKAISEANRKKGWLPVRQRDRIITDRDLPTFFRILEAFRNGEIDRVSKDGEPLEPPPSAPMVADLLELLLFTGLRRGEGAGLKWKDIDFDERTLIARETKNGTDHKLPLTSSIITVLKRRKAQASGSVWVFPSSKGGHVQDPLFIAKLVKSSTDGRRLARAAALHRLASRRGCGLEVEGHRLRRADAHRPGDEERHRPQAATDQLHHHRPETPQGSGLRQRLGVPVQQGRACAGSAVHRQAGREAIRHRVPAA